MKRFDKSCHDMLKDIYEQNLKIIKDGRKREKHWLIGFVILGVFVLLGFFI